LSSGGHFLGKREGVKAAVHIEKNGRKNCLRAVLKKNARSKGGEGMGRGV